MVVTRPAVSARWEDAGRGGCRPVRLIQNDLVDEFNLMIDPVIVGGGKRLFRDDGMLTRLRLVASNVTTTGRDHRNVRTAKD